MSTQTQTEAIQVGRLRRQARTRRLLHETVLRNDMLIEPWFVTSRPEESGPISALPGVNRWEPEAWGSLAEDRLRRGVRTLLLFGVPAVKDGVGHAACCEEGSVPAALRFLRERFPELTLIADVCLCPYTPSGTCLVEHDGQADFEATLDRYAEAANVYAAAGADLVAPSGMVDGMVARIRKRLDTTGHEDCGILSYAVKFASGTYGPFRDAAGTGTEGVDRRGQQLPPGNRREALREAIQDEREGADILMVKPALAYADILRELRSQTDLPLCAYHVSGEYAMIEAAAERGLLDRKSVVLEHLQASARAGANLLISYHAPAVADWLRAEGIAR